MTHRYNLTVAILKGALSKRYTALCVAEKRIDIEEKSEIR